MNKRGKNDILHELYEFYDGEGQEKKQVNLV